jgi:hypothetical protein
MATLAVISFTGDSFSYSLNKETNGSANLNSVKTYLEERTGGTLTWNDNRIRFSRGTDFFEWRGSFRFSDKEEILSGSKVREFERELSNSRYGRILISGISYDAKAEAGAFYSLTVPDEIRDVLEAANTGSYDKPALQSQAYPGFTYNFTTIYDSNGPTGSPEDPTTPQSSKYTLTNPSIFSKSSSDIITNYNPKTDQPIQIDLGSFEGAVGKLKIAKKSNKVAQLAKKNIDFIYDRQQGYLYYNENGKQSDFGKGGIFAILEGSPKVGLVNFEFI